MVGNAQLARKGVADPPKGHPEAILGRNQSPINIRTEYEKEIKAHRARF